MDFFFFYINKLSNILCSNFIEMKNFIKCNAIFTLLMLSMIDSIILKKKGNRFY